MTPTCLRIDSRKAMQHLQPPTIHQVTTMGSCLSLSANPRKWWRAPSKKAVGLVRTVMDILCNLPRNLRSCPILQHAGHREWASLFRIIILLWRRSNSKRQPLRDWAIARGRKGSEILENFKVNFSRTDRLTRKAHLWLKRRRWRKWRKHRSFKEVRGRLKFGAKGL